MLFSSFKFQFHLTTPFVHKKRVAGVCWKRACHRERVNAFPKGKAQERGGRRGWGPADAPGERSWSGPSEDRPRSNKSELASFRARDAEEEALSLPQQLRFY